MEKTKLLELKNKIKKKKPEFIRRDYNKKARLAKKWHRPKGLHNKMRLHKKGNPKTVSSGYRSPVEVRGLTREGLELVVVNTPEDLAKLDAKLQLAILASGLGQRRKADLVKKAKELQLTIENIKDLDKYLSFVESNMKTRKDHKQKKLQVKTKKTKEGEKKAKEKKEGDSKAPEKKTDIEKAVEEKELQQKKKQEKDKILTKRT